MRHHHPKRHRLAALAAGAVIVATAVGCGDDDDTAAGDAGGETTTTVAASPDTTSGGEAAGGGFCDGYQELLAGEPTPESILELAAVAPAEGAAALEALAAGFEEQGDAYFGSEEFSANFATLGTAAVAECADQSIDVTAVDYAYEGMPTELEAGTVGINLANEGTEFHEMVVFRKNDDTAESFDEILGLEDQAAAQALVTQVGATFAGPGGSAAGLFDLSQPGEYLAVCFIPVGTTPDVAEGSGPPHFTEGMQVQFTVS